ncbi:MAG TPA: hypothetical protein VFV34_07300 [Blastocatellia bacterium]|nr:hypothetical protein [Blastocatellia bacterium]
MYIGASIGVMGSAGVIDGAEDCLFELAERLGRTIAERRCVLVTGATTGLPEMVARAARSHGGITVGISPAMNRQEHVELYRLPLDANDIIIYTGFGLKGRNVINIRSSDVVIIFGGGMGTLNEFTIAHDEGKVVGVLEGSGGVADQIREIVRLSRKPAKAKVFYHREPEQLVESCLSGL